MSDRIGPRSESKFGNRIGSNRIVSSPAMSKTAWDDLPKPEDGLKLAFHPLIASAVSKAVQGFLRDETMNQILARSGARVPEIRVSFYRKLPTLSNICFGAWMG